MAEQRNRFSFRLPWLPAARPRTPETQPPRPTVETQPPRPIVETQPTATIRPPFRPAGVAQVQPPPPPQVQAPPPPPPPPRVESQPSSPSRATTESKITSQPASPARGGTLPRVASLPSSPSRGAPQSKPPSSPQSPARAPPSSPQSPARAPRTPPQPRSPSRLISQVQPKSPSRVQPTAAGQTTSTPSSPQTTTQVQPLTAVASQPTGQTRPSSPSPTTTQVQPRAAEASQPDQTQPSTPSRIITHVQPTTAVASQPTGQTQPSSPSPTTTQVQPRAAEASQPGQTQPSSPHITTQVQPTTAVVSQPTGQTRPTSPTPTTTQVQPTSAVASQPTGQTQPTSPSPTTTQAQSTTAVVSQTSSKPGSPSRTTTPVQPTVSVVAPEQILKVLTPIPDEGIKKPQNFAIQQEQEPHVKEAVLEKHETLFPSGTSHDKHFKPAISIHRKDRGAVSESHQRPENISVERAPFHKEIREDISKLVHKLGTAHPKQLMNEKPVSVITLAGENRGASMHLSSESSKKHESVHIYRGYKTNPDESAEATTDGEESSKGKRSRDPMTKEEQPTKPYVNGNVQSINNSILFNSSVTERNPGVHLVLSSNPTVKPNGKTESLETRKAQFNITPAEKHTYEPTVRRRCLRGLFMETSDSEPDNPDKPRRHGCRYNCGEKNKDKEIGVL